MHGMQYPQQGSAPSSSWELPAGVAPTPKASPPQTTPQKDASVLPVASPEDGGKTRASPEDGGKTIKASPEDGGKTNDDQGCQTDDNPDLSGEELILRNAMKGRETARKRPAAVEPEGGALKKPAAAKVGAKSRKATVNHVPKPKKMPPPPVGKAGSNPDAVGYRGARCYTKWSEKYYRCVIGRTADHKFMWDGAGGHKNAWDRALKWVDQKMDS